MISANIQVMMVPIARKTQPGVSATSMILPKTIVIIAKLMYSLSMQVLCAFPSQNSSPKTLYKSMTWSVLVTEPTSEDVLIFSQIGERVVGVGVCGRPDEQVTLGGFESLATL